MTTPPPATETYNASGEDQAVLRDSKESKGQSTGKFGGRVEESRMFSHDKEFRPQQSADQIGNDRTNVIMLTPQEEDRQYQYPEQHYVPRYGNSNLRESGSTGGGDLYHEYRQGPVSAQPSAADEPLSEQDYRRIQSGAMDGDSARNASPRFKSSTEDLRRVPFTAPELAHSEAKQLWTEGSQNGESLLPNHSTHHQE